MTSTNSTAIWTPDTSVVSALENTPEGSTETPPSDAWDGRRFAVPTAGQTYHIFLRDTNKAIMMTEDGGAYLGDNDRDQSKHNVWQCVEKNGYLGFIQQGRYLGHNIFGRMQAAVHHIHNWEYFTVKKHRDGGYKLLMPHWWFALKTVCVVGNGPDLEIRDHGTETWDFVLVD